METNQISKNTESFPLDACCKILSTLLLKRKKPYTEDIVGRYQYDFRRADLLLIVFLQYV